MPAKPQVPLSVISRPHWWDILCVLKRSMGHPVKSLIGELGMSYMGIRQHLDSIEKERLVDGTRRARKVGRPEKVYRLTARGQSLFETQQVDLALRLLLEAENLHGSNAPEKLLLHYYQTLAVEYAEKVQGASMLEKVTQLAKLRDRDGYYAEARFDNEDGLRIEEYHHPLAELRQKFSNLILHEQGLFERVLGVPVKRRENTVGTHQQVVWQVSSVVEGKRSAKE